MRNLVNVTEIKNLNTIKGGCGRTRPRYCAPQPPVCPPPPTCGIVVTPPERAPETGGKPA